MLRSKFADSKFIPIGEQYNNSIDNARPIEADSCSLRSHEVELGNLFPSSTVFSSIQLLDVQCNLPVDI